MTDKKKAQLKMKFRQLDADGNGVLDFNELHDLLTRGNPSFPEDEAWKLYQACDANGDGTIDFDEFLNYIYGDTGGKMPGAAPASRTTDGRHAALAAKSGVGEDGTEGDWGSCKAVYEAFAGGAGKDLDGKEFAKFIKDNHLLNKDFKKTDIDLIFAKVVPKGKRRMDFEQFKMACRHIATKRHQTNGEIQALVAQSHGPELHGTKTEYSKFYDDKSTYTGAATANEKLGADHSHAYGRHEKQAADAAAKLAAGGDEDDEAWKEVETVFWNFCAESGGDGLDGRTWLKLCGDCHLINSKFTKQDVDIVFANVGRKAKKLNFDQFKAGLRQVSQKRGEACYVIQGKVKDAKGPQMHGVTKTEAVKFYDDKSQYTGAAADVFGREGGHGEDRHAKHKAEEDAKLASDGNEHPWDECLVTFEAYAGENGGVDSREFNKICTDLSLFDSKFTKQDVDIVFTKAKGSNAVRALNADTFCAAVRLIAAKKGVPCHQVQQVIASSTGPEMHATKAEYSKFYDDKSTYTGSATANEKLTG